MLCGDRLLYLQSSCATAGGTVDVAGNGELTNNRKDLNHLKDMLHLHHHKHGES